MTTKQEVILILARRDGMTIPEATALVEECQEMVNSGADPEEVLMDELGLEPDYVFAFI